MTDAVDTTDKSCSKGTKLNRTRLHSPHAPSHKFCVGPSRSSYNPSDLLLGCKSTPKSSKCNWNCPGARCNINEYYPPMSQDVLHQWLFGWNSNYCCASISCPNTTSNQDRSYGTENWGTAETKIFETQSNGITDWKTWKGWLRRNMWNACHAW